MRILAQPAVDRRWALALLAALAVSAACESSVETVTAPAQTRCAVGVETSASSFPAAGGAGTLRITTPRECAWTAQSQAGWLVLTSPAAGQGDGDVPFTVSANDAPSARIAGLTVNDQRREISQQGRPCEFGLSSDHETVPAAGGEFTIGVSASSAECGWTAAAGAPWLTILEGGEGRGDGAVRVRAAPSGDPQRSGTLVIAGKIVQIDQGGGCDLSVSPSVIQVGSGGGEQTLAVQATGPGCTWTAVSDAPWITIAGGENRSGSGSFTVRVAATSGPGRSGSVRVAGRTIGVVQGTGCAVSIDSSLVQIPASGGERAVAVAATSTECTWSASSNVPWIAIAGGPDRTGSGALAFHVAANTGPQRSGTLSVAGHAVRVDQASGCAVVIAPASRTFPAEGGGASIDVQVGAACPWTSASSQSWITVTAGASGSGPGRVDIAVTANAGPERSGSVAIGGRTFAVTQASGCSYTIAPTTQQAAGTAGSATVAVSTAAGCPWTADPAADWLSPSPASGSGTGSVGVTWTSNLSPERSGTVRIAGRTFTVTQASTCTYSLVPPSAEFGADGGSGAVLVIVSGPCTWTAESGAGWIKLTSGSSGTDSGVVQFVVSANAGPPRIGFITIAGRQYTVSQGAR